MTDAQIEQLLQAADRPRGLRADELARLRQNLVEAELSTAVATDSGSDNTAVATSTSDPRSPNKARRNGFGRRNGLLLAAAALLVIAGVIGVLSAQGTEESQLDTIDAPPLPTPTARPRQEATSEPVPEPALVAGLPAGVAREYVGTRMLLNPQSPPERVAGGVSVNVSGTLLAVDNTEIVVNVSLLDLREQDGGPVECGGTIYPGPFTSDTDRVSTGVVEIVGVGKMNVRFERSIVVAEQYETGEPICEQNYGTWTGFQGELDGRIGTIERLRIGTEAWWTID